ncbi:hypothetical protein EQO05_11675 [Methanosarcina sp. MSH10X1]|uniref:hypothetical protein n=1 Tax=Methanosarcina sp. MSH10X1 TaxID=2507075 RepID=UPI000FFC50B9|nr:hypothetical protein [Methanosarcina sp. MSH10X1]RXA17809.1 hypothetical protein EQO05_11675 [Methanosarcina sp. MSH10X1]
MIIGGIALVYVDWIGHALIAIISLLVMVHALTTGAMLRGRIKRSSGNLFKLHRKSGIYFGAFILGSFIYGLWIRLEHGEAILSSIHGKLGVAILLIAILQVLPSLILKNRARYRELHRIMGYSLASILIIDAAWGLYNGVTAGIKTLVLIHSISGGLAALVMVWIILEIRYPVDRSLARARLASYLAVFFVTAGCWMAGGYNYLTVYGSQVKPVILAGLYPWAHEIIMEAKEHIFVFLPIITFALSISLYTLDKDTFLGNANSRHALTIVACLALFMVLLMFLMGAIISSAGNTGMEA